MERLDKIFPWKMCITLKGYDNRICHTVNTFAEANWTVQLHVAEKDKESTIRGCYMSHVAVMKKALDANVPYAFVLEDDISIPSNIENVNGIIDEIEQFIQTEPFDILLIGWCPCVGRDTDYCRNICVTTRHPYKDYKYIDEGTCWCTHAIVYSREFMKFFLQNYGDFEQVQEEIDEVLALIPNVRMFMMKEPLVEQNRDAVESAIWGGQPVKIKDLQVSLQQAEKRVVIYRWVAALLGLLLLVMAGIVYLKLFRKPAVILRRK